MFVSLYILYGIMKKIKKKVVIMNIIKFLAKKYNAKTIKLVGSIPREKAGSASGVKFDILNGVLSIELKEDVYYLMQDALYRYIKVIYRNGNLFTQTLKGSKSNFFNVTKKECETLLSQITLSQKEISLLGVGFSIE